MRRPCEVCRSFRPVLVSGTSHEEVWEFQFGKRSVQLCKTHAYILRWSRVTTFEGLRKLFRESNGKRSFIPRRLLGDPRMRERRCSNLGRRAADSGRL